MRGLARALLVVLLSGSGLSAEPPAAAPAAAAKPDATALGQDLASTDLAKRRAAVYALWGIENDAEPALPALAKALADEDEYVRTTAEKIVLKVGPLAMGKPAVWAPTFV